MPTTRKRVARKVVIHKEPLTEALEHYFAYGNLGGMLELAGKVDTFRLLHPFRREKLISLWLKYRKQILAKNKNAWAEKNLSNWRDSKCVAI